MQGGAIGQQGVATPASGGCTPQSCVSRVYLEGATSALRPQAQRTRTAGHEVSRRRGGSQIVSFYTFMQGPVASHTFTERKTCTEHARAEADHLVATASRDPTAVPGGGAARLPGTPGAAWRGHAGARPAPFPVKSRQHCSLRAPLRRLRTAAATEVLIGENAEPRPHGLHGGEVEHGGLCGGCCRQG